MFVICVFYNWNDFNLLSFPLIIFKKSYAMSIFQTFSLCVLVASDVHNPSLITAREDRRDIAERWGGWVAGRLCDVWNNFSRVLVRVAPHWQASTAQTLPKWTLHGSGTWTIAITGKYRTCQKYTRIERASLPKAFKMQVKKILLSMHVRFNHIDEFLAHN